MKFRLYLLWYCVAVFILTFVTFIVLHVGRLPPIFWLVLVLAYIIAPFLIYDSFVEPLMEKLSGKKMLLLTFSIVVIGMAFTESTWVIITPKWAFSVTTDKSTYVLYENVTITVSLKNLGFITHSFRSLLSDPVLLSIEFQPTQNPTVTYQVWYSPFHRNITEFSIGPNGSLERTFVWNQTNIANPWFWNQTYMPGTYQIKAYIPDAGKDAIVMGQHLFRAYTTINITST